MMSTASPLLRNRLGWTGRVVRPPGCCKVTEKHGPCSIFFVLSGTSHSPAEAAKHGAGNLACIGVADDGAQRRLHLGGQVAAQRRRPAARGRDSGSRFDRPSDEQLLGLKPPLHSSLQPAAAGSPEHKALAAVQSALQLVQPRLLQVEGLHAHCGWPEMSRGDSSPPGTDGQGRPGATLRAGLLLGSVWRIHGCCMAPVSHPPPALVMPWLIACAREAVLP